jgi:hypothetical protein
VGVTDGGLDGSLAVYSAFGLRLRSDVPLPELPVVIGRDAPPDVEVRLLDALVTDRATPPVGLVDVSDDITMLWWSHVGRFVVSDGCDICVARAPTVDPATLRLYLLGPVLTALLHQRGWIVVRAGAALKDGRAIAFVPPAACDTFAARGHTIIAREVVAIRAGDHATPALVQPCVPWLARRPLDPLAARRLWCDAARAEPPRPLDALYILSESEEAPEALTCGEAFAELGACLFDDLTWPGNVRRALRLMFHLASTLSLRRVRVGVAARDSVGDIRG